MGVSGLIRLMCAAALIMLAWPRAVFCAPGATASVLLPPGKLPTDPWLIRQHGVRNGPLDPSVWGTRKDQRTESARIISIKPYYLRSSENPEYRLDHILIHFSYWVVSKADMEFSPQEKDPLLEVEFAGKLSLGTGGELAPIDRGYDLRLSAFPPLPSGLFFRSRLLTLPLAQPPRPLLKTGKRQELEGFFSAGEARFTLNGAPYLTVTGKGLNTGLLSLSTGWSPVSILKLEVDGHLENSAEISALHESGLILLPSKPKGKKADDAPAATDNKELDKALLRPVEEEATR